MKSFRNVGRALALAAGFAIAAVAGAQTAAPAAASAAAPAKPAAAKAAKPAKKAAAPAYKMTLEPKAMDLLKALSARLAAAKSMAFTAVVGYESPASSGRRSSHDPLRRHDAAARQAAHPDSGRRARVRVLLRRQGDDGLRPRGEPRGGRRRPADDRRRAEGRLQQRGDLLPVHGPAGRRSLRGADRRRGARVLRRAFGRRRGRQDQHGRVGQQRRLHADLDRHRRQAAAAGPGDLRADPAQLRHEMELSNWQLDGAVPPETFASAKAQAAGRMEFAAPKGPPPGVKPIVKTRPSQPKPAAAAPKAN